MNVDLPTPGTPEMPTRTVGLVRRRGELGEQLTRGLPVVGRGRLSTRVIARDTSARRRARTPSTSAGTSPVVEPVETSQPPVW